MVKINKFNGSEVIVSVKNTKFKATINTIEVDVDGYRTAHAHPSEAYSNTAKIFITTAKGTKTFLYHHIEEDIDSFFEIFTRDGLIYCNILPTQLANSILNEIHGVKKDTNESKKHTKQTIRLTESQFNEVISKTIKKVLRESMENKEPINTIEDVRRENKKPLRNKEKTKLLFIVKVVPKNGGDIYYDTALLPKWVNIGGNYGTKNELWVVEKF